MKKKLIKFTKYFLSIFRYYDVCNYIRCRYWAPEYYDIFFCERLQCVCVIAPYYSFGGFTGSMCRYVISGKQFDFEAEILNDPEKGCLVVTYPFTGDVGGGFLGYSIFSNHHKIISSGNCIQNNTLRRNKLSIAMLFKYEVDFLKEWIDFHITNGVGHFYLYENNSIPDARAKLVLEPYIKCGYVTYNLWPHDYDIYHYRLKKYWPNDAHIYTQLPQINHAIYKYGNETDFLLCCDVDEYFYLTDGKVILDYIENVMQTDGVSSVRVSGFWFGGREDQLESLYKEGVTKTYILSERYPSSAKKCIFKMGEVRFASVHNAVIMSGREVDLPITPLRFNHYRALGWKRRLDDKFACELVNKDITLSHDYH